MKIDFQAGPFGEATLEGEEGRHCRTLFAYVTRQSPEKSRTEKTKCTARLHKLHHLHFKLFALKQKLPMTVLLQRYILAHQHLSALAPKKDGRVATSELAPVEGADATEPQSSTVPEGYEAPTFDSSAPFDGEAGALLGRLFSFATAEKGPPSRMTPDGEDAGDSGWKLLTFDLPSDLHAAFRGTTEAQKLSMAGVLARYVVIHIQISHKQALHW